ncbi:hypothetical protein CR513_43048, partial [Mucuna pruriens]
MELDLKQHVQVNLSGLTRYQLALSSYLSNIIDREFYEYTVKRLSSPETERVFWRFMNSLSSHNAEDSLHQKLSTDSAVKEEDTNEEHVALQQSNNYNSASHNFLQASSSSSKPPLPNQSLPQIWNKEHIRQNSDIAVETILPLLGIEAHQRSKVWETATPLCSSHKIKGISTTFTLRKAIPMIYKRPANQGLSMAPED